MVTTFTIFVSINDNLAWAQGHVNLG